MPPPLSSTQIIGPFNFGQAKIKTVRLNIIPEELAFFKNMPPLLFSSSNQMMDPFNFGQAKIKTDRLNIIPDKFVFFAPLFDCDGEAAGIV